MAHNLAPLGAGHYRRPKSNSFLSPLNPSAQVAKRERGNTIDSPISFKPPLPLHLQQQQQQQQQQQMQQQQMQQYQGQQNYQVQQQSNLPLTAVLQLRRNGTPKRGSKHHYWSLRSSGNTNTHFSIGLSLRNNINQEVLDFCQNCLQPLPPLSPSSVSSPDLSCCARPLRGFVQNDCKIAGSVIECTGDCSLGSICEPLAHLSPDEPRSLSTVPFIPTSSSSSSSSSAAPTLSSSPANASSLANGPGGVSPGSSVPGNSQEDPVQLSGLIPPTVEPGRILKLKVHQHVLVAVTVGLHHFAYDPTITRPSAQPAVTSFPTQRDVTPITINCCMMAKPDVKCGMVKFNNLIGPAVICTAKGISMEKLPASLCGPTTFAPTHPINAPNIAPQISSPSSAPSHSHSFLSHSPSSFHMGPPSFQPGTPPSSFHFSQQLQQQQQSNHANSNHLVHNNNNNNNLTPQQQQHLMNMSNSNNQQSGFSSGVRTPPLSNSGGLSSSPFDSQNNQNSNGGGNGNGNGSGFSNYLSSPFLLPQLIGSSSSSSSSSTQSPSMFQQQHHQQQQQSGMFGSAPSQSFLRQPSTFQEAMMQRHEFSQPDSSFSSGDVFMQQQQQHPQQQQQGQGDWMQDSFSQDDALYFPPAQHNMMDSSVIPHFNNGAGNNNNNNNSGGIPINSSPMQGLIGQSGNNNNGGSGQLSFARPFDHIKPENSWSDSMSRSAPATFSGPGLFDIMQHHQQQQQQQFQQQQQHQFQQQQHQFQQQQNQQQQQPQFSMGFHRTMGNNNGGMGFQNANPNANMGMGMSMGMGLGPGGFGQVTAGFERSTTPTNWSVASPTDSCASTADFEMGPGWNMEMDGGEQAYAANSSADQIDVNQYFNNSMDGGSSTEANYDSDGSSSVMAGPGSTSPFLSHNPTHHHNNNNNSGNMPIGQGSPLHQNQNQNQNSAFGAPRFPFQ